MDAQVKGILGLIAITLWFASIVYAVCIGRDVERQQAIEAGVGYWAVDEKTGATEFKWRTCGGDAAERTRN